jgi:hypothetical protein
MLSKTITTAEGESEFQLRVLKEEGVGLLTTRSQRSYLILDSLDFWYDLIQTAYPPKKNVNAQMNGSLCNLIICSEKMKQILEMS